MLNDSNRDEVKVAAIQLEAKVGDLHANLAACENMANEAAKQNAKWIILPEFFTTGMAFDPRITGAIQPSDGKALNLLLDLAKRHQAFVGGSFIVRDENNGTRNAFFLASPEGVLGRHDKDIPTMWENCFYAGGQDDGIIETPDHTVGSALCWEFMRSQTARRLRGKVDVIVGGSCWWSVPSWVPGSVTSRWEEKNEHTALESVRSFATYVGAPIIHAAHTGSIDCRLPCTPFNYKGHYEGGSMIVDSEGKIVAVRDHREGQGIITGKVRIGRTEPIQEVPKAYWLHKRGPIPSFAWTYQRWHGKHWYKKNVVGK
ncbi:carbon-nitrogen hydrolase family protein [Filibacter tadaridae]|uniref:C-N hydrolase family amidase n=1 Tax=Filibacter tadaridae TaxID=2483811 RepID=A0A3P5XX84_9BACL|nr:carbon-nitrogen hydrolase family protein [Filibacter tadaridae]VDC33792.1 C-N hydrolase family amidase [Filibacter tadaridae]